MHILILLLFTFFGANPPAAWNTNFENARQQAASGQKLILLNFSGSDWCIPCIKMEETFFDDPAFKDFADTYLILLKADFPRLKKNQLDPRLLKQNEKLAEKYNTNGVFPMTLILSAEGKVLNKFEGLPKGNVEDFIESLKIVTTK